MEVKKEVKSVKIPLKPKKERLPSERIGQIVDFLKKHDHRASRTEVAKEVGAWAGPVLYSMKKQGIVEREETEAGIFFNLVKK